MSLAYLLPQSTCKCILEILTCKWFNCLRFGIFELQTRNKHQSTINSKRSTRENKSDSSSTDASETASFHASAPSCLSLLCQTSILSSTTHASPPFYPVKQRTQSCQLQHFEGYPLRRTREMHREEGGSPLHPQTERRASQRWQQPWRQGVECERPLLGRRDCWRQRAASAG